MVTYPARGMQRILAGSATPVLRTTLRDQDGEALATLSGTLTCNISRADGTVVATDRSATFSAGVLTCALTTSEALTLDVLEATWEVDAVVRATTHHRVVGGFMFSVADLAQRAGMQAFDVAALREERDRITDVIERYCGAQVPHYDLVAFEGHGFTRHALWHRPLRRLRSLTIGDTVVDLTTTDIDVDHAAGVIRGVTFQGQCGAGYEHGLDAPDADLRDAALTASADRLLRGKGVLGPRVRSATNELGITQQFGYAGAGHPTGLDEVDAVIMDRAQARL